MRRRRVLLPRHRRLSELTFPLQVFLVSLNQNVRCIPVSAMLTYLIFVKVSSRLRSLALILITLNAKCAQRGTEQVSLSN